MRKVVGAVALLSLLSGCGATAAGTTPMTPPTSMALVVTSDGLAGVPVGSSTPSWRLRDAVAAPDGSAAFVVEDDDEYDVILRVDPRHGSTTEVGKLPSLEGRHVAAVDPGGRRIALAATASHEQSTVVTVFDTATGRAASERTFDGDLEPEAFSVDGSRIFAARSYGAHYHVVVLETETGQQSPTIGPDKTQAPEEMYGSVVQAALSPDGRQLATLYRDAVRPDHPAFVHLLARDSGLTVCVDLAAPFGTSGRRTDDRLEWADGDTVVVGHLPARGDATVVSFSASGIWAGDALPHYHAESRPDLAPPALPAGLEDVPGLQRFVALLA